ncbi:protocadherin alpha-C2-like isoform X2 [Girardinichthys multiradiatus]|uniref:protocadherin alpha-C2-like isoform X2 n=1 Tax=Girardinichthys multiradiatus TaxID=208333 RepID=UPI001FACB9C0|nr:protocadherin alpha-C2-like isoform X2 [Girardinichthys multiradiatus]
MITMAFNCALLRTRSFVAVFTFIALWGFAFSITRYSIPEEMEEGSFVANLATDLGLDVRSLLERNAKLDVIHSKNYLDINKDTGELIIRERMDRESICMTKTTSCFLKMDVILSNPVRIFNIELEILDINDNAPVFRRKTMHLDVSETTPPGERFSLTNAVDADVGANSVKTYYLSESRYFSISIQTGSDGSKYVDLVLSGQLDREEHAVHNLILTAVDGGVPARSGTASIIINVLDINDNAPTFSQSVFAVNVSENSPVGTVVMTLNATDLDEGTNAKLIYSYTLYTSEKTQELFSLDPNSGEIRVKAVIDYEESQSFEMHIQAQDRGANPLSGHCKVMVFITDLNDNHPEVTIKSLKRSVAEDVSVGTLIAVVSVTDRDSGVNGEVDLILKQQEALPFLLNKSSEGYFELLVSKPLDREVKGKYDIKLIVTDRGIPALSENETITLEILDVNDNEPLFSQSFYTIHVVENNPPGALLTSLSAHDPDLNENQYLVYFIMEKEIVNISMSMLFSINPENGDLYGLKTFDYEREKEFLFHIEARDSGVPPLSSNVTVHIVILDQNDNTPLIVSPWRAHGSVVEEVIPRSTEKGHLVTKVVAIDADSDQNARVTYQLLQISDSTLFSLDQYNGEIRTTRMFSYRDPRQQRLVVVAKDNGQPALSATVTIKISTVEHAMTFLETTELPLEYEVFTNLNLYLVIGLGAVSFMLLITILVIIVLKCQKPKPKAIKMPPVNRNSLISQRSSTIADSTLISSDAYWYSLFLAETRKGKVVVRQPIIPKGAGYFVSSIPRSIGTSETSDSRASTLEESRREL